MRLDEVFWGGHEEKTGLLDNDDYGQAVMDAGYSNIDAQGCSNNRPQRPPENFDDLGQWSTTDIQLCGLHGHAPFKKLCLATTQRGEDSNYLDWHIGCHPTHLSIY
jgi:hypothetical protein